MTVKDNNKIQHDSSKIPSNFGSTASLMFALIVECCLYINVPTHQRICATVNIHQSPCNSLHQYMYITAENMLYKHLHIK